MSIDLDKVAKATGGVHIVSASAGFKPNAAYDKILKDMWTKQLPESLTRLGKPELDKFRTYALAKRHYGAECAEVDSNVVRQLNILRDKD